MEIILAIVRILHTCMHACMHAYIHINTCMQECMRACIYMRALAGPSCGQQSTQYPNGSSVRLDLSLDFVSEGAYPASVTVSSVRPCVRACVRACVCVCVCVCVCCW